MFPDEIQIILKFLAYLKIFSKREKVVYYRASPCSESVLMVVLSLAVCVTCVSPLTSLETFHFFTLQTTHSAHINSNFIATLWFPGAQPRDWEAVN